MKKLFMCLAIVLCSFIVMDVNAASEGKDIAITNTIVVTDNFFTKAQYVALSGTNNIANIYGEEHIGDDFCSQPEILNAMRVLGYFIFIAKILIPLIIIGFSVFDMFHAVTGGDDKSLKDSAKKLGIRIIIGISVFLVPTILNTILTAVDLSDDVLSDSHICQTCLLKPQECESGVPSDTNPFDEDVFVPGETYETPVNVDDADNGSEETESSSNDEVVVE